MDFITISIVCISLVQVCVLGFIHSLKSKEIALNDVIDSDKKINYKLDIDIKGIIGSSGVVSCISSFLLFVFSLMYSNMTSECSLKNQSYDTKFEEQRSEYENKIYRLSTENAAFKNEISSIKSKLGEQALQNLSNENN